MASSPTNRAPADSTRELVDGLAARRRAARPAPSGTAGAVGGRPPVRPGFLRCALRRAARPPGTVGVAAVGLDRTAGASAGSTAGSRSGATAGSSTGPPTGACASARSHTSRSSMGSAGDGRTAGTPDTRRTAGSPAAPGVTGNGCVGATGGVPPGVCGPAAAARFCAARRRAARPPGIGSETAGRAAVGGSAKPGWTRSAEYAPAAYGAISPDPYPPWGVGASVRPGAACAPRREPDPSTGPAPSGPRTSPASSPASGGRTPSAPTPGGTARLRPVGRGAAGP